MQCQTQYMSQVFSRLYNPRFSNLEDGLSYVRINRQQKEKKIHKCEHFCQKHKLSLKKTSNNCKQSPLFKNYDNTEVIFCPNQYFGMTSGGYPVYNHDERSDTPAFINKYQMPNSIFGNKLYSQQFLKRKNRIQQQKTTLEMNSQLEKQLNSYSQSKSNFNGQVIADFQNILKKKTQGVK